MVAHTVLIGTKLKYFRYILYPFKFSDFQNLKFSNSQIFKISKSRNLRFSKSHFTPRNFT